MNSLILDYHQEANLNLDKLNNILNEVKSNRQYGDIIWNENSKEKSQHEKSLIEQIERKLIENNETFSRYPSDYIHCLMSLDSFFEHFKNTTRIFNNEKWKILDQFSEYASNQTRDKLYSAYLYINDENQQLVLAFSGTILDIPVNFKMNQILNDQIESVILNQIVPQLVKCYEMTLQANKIAKTKNYYLSFTGYSNGAWLAEYSYYFSIRYFDNFKTKAVLFDSQGILQNSNDNNFFEASNCFDNEFDPKNFNIVNYLTMPHFSNSISKHRGITYRIFVDEKRNQDLKQSFLDSIQNKFPQIYNCLKTSRFFLDGLLSILDFKRLELIKDLFDPITGLPNYYEKMSRFPLIKVKLNNDFQDKFRNMSKQPIKTLVNFIPLSNLIKSPSCFILEQLFTNISDGLRKNIAPGIHIFFAILSQLINENVNLSKFDVSLFEKKNISTSYNEKEKNLNKNYDLLQIADKNDVYLDIKNQYSLLLSSYYEIDPYSDKYKSKLNIKYDEKNIDWCLNQLKKVNLDQSKPSKLANYQLNKLKSLYTIKPDNEKDVKILYTNTITADMLKERMLRLISLHPNIRDLLSNVYGEPYHNQIRHKLNQRVDPFIGRENLFEKITEILSMKEHNLVVLSGQSGNGKSYLANEYAHRVKDDISNITIRWFNCETRDKINSEFLNLAKLLKLNEIENVQMDDLIMRVNTKLQDSTSSKMNFLFILDNVNNFKMIDEIFLQKLSKRNFKFIIMTENSSEFSKKLTINVDFFDLDEARDYVTKYSKQNLTEAQINYLINSLTTNENEGIQPLKLNLIVKYMNKYSTASFDSIYSKIHEDRLNTSYRKIFENFDSQVSDFLSYLGYLDGDSISFELLKRIYLKNNYSVSFDQMLDTLTSQGFIEMNFEQQSIKIHKIIQNEIDKYIHSSSNKDTVFKNLVNILNEHFETSSNNYDYIHLIKIQKTQHQLNDFDTLKLKHKLANYHLNSLSEYEKSLKLNLEVNDWFHNHNKNHNYMYSKELSTSYSRISEIYTRLQDYRKALEYSEKSHQIKMNLYDQIELHPDLAQSFTNSGSIYSKLNMDQIAVDCDKNAYFIRSGLYENMDHRELARSLNNLGVSYSRIDETKSYEYRMKAYEMQSRIFKQKNGNQQNDHHDLAIGLKNMGLFYLKKGDYHKALKSLQESYDMSYRLYKCQDHSELANLLNNLGTCHEHLNHIEDAYKNFMKSFDMRSRLFNNNMNHPDLIESKYLIDKINAKRRLLEQNNQNNVNNFNLQCDKCFKVIKDKEELFTCSICDDYHMCMNCYSKLNKKSESELNHQIYHPLIKFDKQDYLKQNWFEIWNQNFKLENVIKKSAKADSLLKIMRICSYCRENINGDLYIKYDKSTCSCIECWVKNNRNKIVYQPVELKTQIKINSSNSKDPLISKRSEIYNLRLYCDKCDNEILNNTLYSCTICNNYHMCMECFGTFRVSSDGHEKFHPLIQFHHNQNLLQSKRWKNIWSENYRLETLIQKNLKNIAVNNLNKSDYCSFCNDLIDGLTIKFGFRLKNSCINCWIKYRNSARMIEPVEINYNDKNSINKNKSVTFSDDLYLETITSNQSSKIVCSNIQSF